MPAITWNHICHFCHRPITRGRPALVFSTERPELVGLSHSTCCATKYRYCHYQMNPPRHLSSERVSFLVQFYPMLYSLPGGFNVPNSDLRRCVAYTLWDYPKSLVNPLECLRKFRLQNIGLMQPYEGDLEADYLKFLARVQKAAKENPVDVEFDFL
jgi:hypothetical protein